MSVNDDDDDQPAFDSNKIEEEDMQRVWYCFDLNECNIPAIVRSLAFLSHYIFTLFHEQNKTNKQTICEVVRVPDHLLLNFFVSVRQVSCHARYTDIFSSFQWTKKETTIQMTGNGIISLHTKIINNNGRSAHCTISFDLSAAFE